MRRISGWVLVAAMFVLDTSVFIDVRNKLCAGKVTAKFSSEFNRLENAGKLCSIEPVKYELCNGTDDLVRWAKKDFAFRPVSGAQVQKYYHTIVKQACVDYEPDALYMLTDGADGWLVAYAKTHGYTVVTNEKAAPRRKTVIKVPDVCEAHSVRCINRYELVQSLKIKLP